MDARDIARLKERKIRYQLQQREADEEEEGMAPVPPTNAPTAHRGQGNQDQQELLSRITHQLEDLSVHLVRGGRGPPPNQEQARGPRRQAQEYHCYNCGENGHGTWEERCITKWATIRLEELLMSPASAKGRLCTSYGGNTCDSQKQESLWTSKGTLKVPEASYNDLDDLQLEVDLSRTASIEGSEKAMFCR
ncbi:hypothetical protein L7F22_027891 [Adiantum nelumboides]|nr:hypothetical protein [Adiantum nelumboides]